METLINETASSTPLATRALFNVALQGWLKENLKEGELYAGMILDDSGQAGQHVILLAGDVELDSWDASLKWATNAGGDLPTCREQALLYANLKNHFEGDWYWSNEQHATFTDYAWHQHFDNGNQFNFIKSAGCRARAVRRLPI